MDCGRCSFDNASGRKFCAECGNPLRGSCLQCGATNEPSAKFCGECGSRLNPDASPGAPNEAARATLAAERRIVSVLFIDLVGFTPYSEKRDAEEVLGLLDRYYQEARTLVGRYGGTIEKFIGDAVVALWGYPAAQEDDAERAVRTGLDLVAAVTSLGADMGLPTLQARGGVMTGEAAVGVEADESGMSTLAGDIVNTAARIQSAADPGDVLVGAATHAATEAAIAYEAAGTFALKGKEKEVPLWRAARVVAARGGAMRSFGLEAPFAGRDRELRLIKELFHTTAERKRAQMVTIVGDAGSGKSRLAWEFEKYLDGLAERVLWHLGRCPAYGESVAHWALADMVRARARILENDPASIASAKLREAVATYVDDVDDRRLVETRLAQLIGLESATRGDFEVLFGAWRLFFERMAAKQPTVMVFEDVQWADASLMAFIEHLLEWSADHALFIVVLTRPEAFERHPSLTVAKRSATSVYLEPLPADAMNTVLDGLVPGLPGDLRDRILGHAEGVPLYAVETVRMLVAREALVLEGSTYRLQQSVESLEIPDSLQTLISARLDALAADERAVIRDAAVLGKTFTKAGLVALAGSEDGLDNLLTSLVRKEIIFLQADERSPERGQYAFLQDLIRRVAYDTLSFADRKRRHLIVADYLERIAEPGSYALVEVLASHLLDACRAAPDAPDAPAIRSRAIEVLERAGQRAASLGANHEARLRFDQAAELCEGAGRRAQLLLASAQAAHATNEGAEALERTRAAAALAAETGDALTIARALALEGERLLYQNDAPAAIERLEKALGTLSRSDAAEDWATVAATLARMHVFSATGTLPRALELADAAMGIAESLHLFDILSQAMNTKAIALRYTGRYEECLALLRHANDIAVDHDLTVTSLRAQGNLLDILAANGQLDEAADLGRAALATARRLGNRVWESLITQNLLVALSEAGRWDEAVALHAESPVDMDARAWDTVLSLARIHVLRGEPDVARRLVDALEHLMPDDPQLQASRDVSLAYLRFDAGDAPQAFLLALNAIGLRDTLGPRYHAVDAAYDVAFEAARASGDVEAIDRLLSEIDARRPGDISPKLSGQAARFKASRAAERGDADAAHALYRTAESTFRPMFAYPLAATLVEHADWLAATGRSDDVRALAAEAADLLAGLKAAPLLERLGRITAEDPTPNPTLTHT